MVNDGPSRFARHATIRKDRSPAVSRPENPMRYLCTPGLEWSKKIPGVDLIRLGGYPLAMKNEAGIFKALADETRLRILLLLLDGELCVCEIIAALELPQSTVSRHLAYLKRTGWVSDRKQGVWMYYCLIDKNVLIRELQPVLEKHLAGSQVHRFALKRLRTFQKQQDQPIC